MIFMKEAKAYISRLDVSYKDLMAVADLIRYRTVKEAFDLLEKAKNKDIFVPYRKNNKKMGHRKHGIKGRYPIKAVKHMIKALKSCIANAKNKGLAEDNLIISHLSIKKGPIYYRIQPKGKPYTHRLVYASIDIKVSDNVRNN